MQVTRRVVLACLVAASVSAASAQAHVGWSIGLNFGPPVYYRPWGFYYYRPYPVIVQPAPVYVQPVPVYPYQPAYQTAAPPPPPMPVPQPTAGSSVTPAAATTVSQRNDGGLIQLLAHPDEQARADAAMQLGRLKAMNAIDPLAATLAGDRSPAARDAAARALGLIGSPKALAALKYAAQADADRDVRHSAQFSIEVIQSGMKR
jgi:hypothetical protein